MQGWLKLDPERVNKGKPRQIRGVEINVLLSPYDVPRAVRGYYDNGIDRFVIEFSYLEDEPWSRSSQDPNIALRIGKNSQRLLGIEVNVKAVEAEAVELKMHVAAAVSKAIEHLASQHNRKEASYEVAKNVIADRQGQLFEGLVQH